jgi:hypothetical protein
MDQQRLGAILRDVSPGQAEAFDVSFVEGNGHPVLVCHGPGTKLCPLLGGEGCSKVDSAHGIVFQLDLVRPQHRDIVRRYRALTRPDLLSGWSSAPERRSTTPLCSERLRCGRTNRASPSSTGSRPAWKLPTE